MVEEMLITVEGLKQMEEDLENLKTVRRKEIAGRIKQAIEFGDISENSEYEDAKNEQAFIEGQIMSLEKQLKNARIINEADVITTVVSEYSTVKLRFLEDNSEKEVQIVGTVESKPFEGKISNESPIGNAVLGHKIGDILDITVPAGIVKVEILDIRK